MLLRVIQSLRLATLLVVIGGSSSAIWAQSFDLVEPTSDSRTFSVTSQVTIEGQFETPNVQGKSSSWKAKSDASYRYRRRRLPPAGRDAAALREVRYYEYARANTVVDSTETNLRLHPEISVLVAQGRENGISLFSPEKLLRRDDIDLLNCPGDGLSVLALLPRSAVELGEKWNVDTWGIQMFGDVDAILKASMVCELTSVEDEVATVAFSGEIEGASSGAPTKISLVGSFEYRLKGKFVSRLRLKQSEQRQVGAVSPGMNVDAEVDLSRVPTVNDKGLEDKRVAELPLEPMANQTLLVYDSPWKVRFLHDRAWHLFHKTDRLVILRLLDQGRLVSQCNLLRVVKAMPGQHTSEDQFQADIRSSLGTRLSRIVSAEQLKGGPNEQRFIYRVVALGTANERELRWIYYLVANPDGRQVSFVFAVDSSDVDALKDRDVSIVTSVEFLERDQPRTAGP